MSRSSEREARRIDVLRDFSAQCGVSIDRLDLGQQWVVFAALQVAAFLGQVTALKRVLGYLLAHSGMDLGGKVIAAIVGVSDRAVRAAHVLNPAAMLHSVRHPTGGHRRPKLRAEHAGVVAKYLVEHRGAEVADILAFVRTDLGVTMDRLTLRRFCTRYGLGCLRGDWVTDAAPLLARPISEVHSS